MSEAAARLDDPIEHSRALGGLLAGLAIGAGAVLVGIAFVATGGLGAVALCAMVGAGAATGAGIGQLLGSLSFACHGAGQIKTGSGNVFTNGKAAARAHVDTAVCDQHGPAPQIVAQGSDSVYINGQPAARVGDRTVCDGKISSGSANVFIGGGTETTDVISPEVPGWLERAVMVVGLGSAFVLASPVIVIAGLVGGIAGGLGGNWAGGKLFGEGSDGQKLMAFGGALLGGGLGAKGGKWFDARYEIKVQGLGSNLGNVKIVPKNTPVSEPLPPTPPRRGPDGRFLKSSEDPVQFNRKSQYPSGYRAGVKDKVLDARTIQDGPDAGKVLTADLDVVPRTDSRITIEHNKPVVEHWNEQGYNSSRSARNDFYNNTDNMSIRLRSANSSDGGKMAADGVRYRQDVGPDFD
ncbi:MULTISPECIES: PAAR domain-containing protein [unclassified Pseudomonas]|uniref:PAAR domain-containing protein n=1 Tax=unclassified Pseudomonas TaxID=196821 RepID=UPI0015A49AF1|nr:MULTISPECIES: PAAR domain-containing protein [unclassified Pseudomonas]NWC93005.1 PAAR domain-containing protein [Pseudomonas sp. IPO3779]NWD19423.1 PAAR domain-containing protein [Pseudomonas sp. IPO3778]